MRMELCRYIKIRGKITDDAPHSPRSTQHLAVRRVFLGSEPCLVLDCAAFRTLYVGALRDSRWPTLSAFLREMSFFAQKKQKILTLTSPSRKTDSPIASRTKNWLDMPKFSFGAGGEPSRQAVIRHPPFAFSDPTECFQAVDVNLRDAFSSRKCLWTVGL